MHLITQSIACFPSTADECYCKWATSALLAEGSPVSTFVQTVTSRHYLGSAQAAGCASSAELSPATLLQIAATEDKSVSIFTSLVSMKHGGFPNNPEILYEQENCFRLQFYGTADNGRGTCVFSCCFPMPLQQWKLQIRFGISLLPSSCFASYWIFLKQQDLETLYRLLGESQKNIPQREYLPFLLRLWTNHPKCSGSPSDVAFCGFAQWNFLRMCHERLGKSWLLTGSLPQEIWEVLWRATQGSLWQKLHALFREWRTETNSSSTVPGKKNKYRALRSLYCRCDLAVEDSDVGAWDKTIGFT